MKCFGGQLSHSLCCGAWSKVETTSAFSHFKDTIRAFIGTGHSVDLRGTFLRGDFYISLEGIDHSYQFYMKFA
jgi:hypothetical protein